MVVYINLYRRKGAMPRRLLNNHSQEPIMINISRWCFGDFLSSFGFDFGSRPFLLAALSFVTSTLLPSFLPTWPPCYTQNDHGFFLFLPPLVPSFLSSPLLPTLLPPLHFRHAFISLPSLYLYQSFPFSTKTLNLQVIIVHPPRRRPRPPPFALDRARPRRRQPVTACRARVPSR